MAQKVKNPPAMQEMCVRPLGREDPLEEEMASHSCRYSCLEDPMDRGAWGATGRIEVGHGRVLNIFCFCGESCFSLLWHSFFFFFLASCTITGI